MIAMEGMFERRNTEDKQGASKYCEPGPGRLNLGGSSPSEMQILWRMGSPLKSSCFNIAPKMEASPLEKNTISLHRCDSLARVETNRWSGGNGKLEEAAVEEKFQCMYSG